MPALSWSDVSKLLLFSHSLIHSPVWIFRIQHRSPHPALSTPDFFHLYTFIVYTSMKTCLVSCKKFTTLALVDINFSNVKHRHDFSNYILGDLFISRSPKETQLEWGIAMIIQSEFQTCCWVRQGASNTSAGARLSETVGDSQSMADMTRHDTVAASWILITSCLVCHDSSVMSVMCHKQQEMSMSRPPCHQEPGPQNTLRTLIRETTGHQDPRRWSHHLGDILAHISTWESRQNECEQWLIFSRYLKSIVCPRV